MKVTKYKNCYCHTCDKSFHYLGINMHRAMHRTRKQTCEITYTNGNRIRFNYVEDSNERTHQ